MPPACEHPVTDHDLLLRIDEKVLSLHAKMEGFVTKEEFKPVKSIVYGLVGAVLCAFLAAIIGLVIRK